MSTKEETTCWYCLCHKGQFPDQGQGLSLGGLFPALPFPELCKDLSKSTLCQTNLLRDAVKLQAKDGEGSFDSMPSEAHTLKKGWRNCRHRSLFGGLTMR